MLHNYSIYYLSLSNIRMLRDPVLQCPHEGSSPQRKDPNKEPRIHYFGYTSQPEQAIRRERKRKERKSLNTNRTDL